MLETVMGNQKVLGFKISEISELARMEFEKKKNSTRNYLGKPDKKITESVLRQLKEHEKFLKNKF
jgi:ribonucleotide monophosphatase NagD (HAD superfamily)